MEVQWPGGVREHSGRSGNRIVMVSKAPESPAGTR